MKDPKKPLFFSGTSGIVLPIKQLEYPSEYKGASRLTYYASLFSSIEINATFYKLPRPDTVMKWRDSVPHDFRFTFKVPRDVTHVKGLQFSGADVAAFAEIVKAAGDKNGCLLLQLPPSIKREREEELNALLENLSADASGWKIAVEFRDKSWYTRAVYRMVQQYGATVVEQDLPASATPALDLPESFAYLRFHGPEGGYRGSYEGAFLERQADRIAALTAAGKEVYVYFNNTLGLALQNLQTLNSLVKKQ